MKIYLLRHGHRGKGKDQDVLTKIGKEQARRTALYFKDKQIEKIICGSYNRAKDTAKLILEELDCPIEYTNEINEQMLGIYEGTSGKDWKEAIKKSGLSEKKFRPQEGENREDAYNRAISFFNKLKKIKENNLLIVSHAGFISDLITLFLKFPEKKSVHFKTSFCAISFFEIDENFNVKNYKLGEITHLAKKEFPRD